MTKYIFMSIAILAYLYFGYDLDSHDLFKTNRFYFRWFESLSKIALNKKTFVSVFTNTAATIAAFEPISVFIAFVLSKLLNFSNIIHLTNILFIIVSYKMVNSKNKFNILIFTLITIEFLFGYYSSILLFQTHRLKFAIIVFYLLLINKSSLVKLTTIPILLHFSFLIISPLIYYYSNSLIKVRDKLKYIVGVVLLIAIFYNISIQNSQVFQVVLNKLEYFNVSLNYIYFFVIIFLIFMFFEHKIKKIMSYLIVLYFISIFLFIDLSRILMLVYLVLAPLIIYNGNKSIFIKKTLTSITLLISIFCWSIFRGINFSLI